MLQLVWPVSLPSAPKSTRARRLPKQVRMTGTTDHVLYAAIVFLAIHLVPGTPLRAQAVRAMGEGAYRGVFSLASAVVLTWLIFAYADAPYEELWPQAPWSRWVTVLVLPVALILLVFSLTSRNPSMAGMEKSVDEQFPVTGILTVTRHPMLWSFALWALGL